MAITSIGYFNNIKWVLIAVFTFSSIMISAQEQDEDYEQDYEQEYDEEYFENRTGLVEVDYIFGVPLGTFKDQLEHNIHGFGINFLHQRKFDSPHFIGAKFKYFRLDSDSNTLSSQGFDFNRFVRSNLLSSEALFRMYTARSYLIFDPYLELSLGASFFYTTVLEEELTTEGSNVDVEEFDVALSYGVGVGTHIKLFDSITLNLKIVYNSGTIANYLIEESEMFIDPLQNFEPRSSSFDHLESSIGLTFAFE